MNTTFCNPWGASPANVGGLTPPVVSRSNRTLKTKAKTLGVSMAMVLAMMILSAPKAEAGVIDILVPCLSGTGSLVGRLNPGATTAQAIDGSGTYSTAAGCNASGNGQLAPTVFGSFSQATGTGASVFGFNSVAARFGSSFGIETRATGTGSTALGYGAEASSINSVAIGGSAGTGTTSLAAGLVTRATGAGAVAIGANTTRGAQATADDAIAIGGQASAAGARTVAIGLNAQGGIAAETDGIAIGSNAAVRMGSTAIGAGASAAQSTQTALNGGVAIGTQASTGVTSTRGIAIGSGATVNSAAALDGGMAIGAAAAAGASNALALGTSAAATQAGAVALGNGSVTAAAVQTVDVTLNGTTYGFAGTAPTSTVSVGSALNQRTVTNVAAGRLGIGSTDAVNGSQLNATNLALNATGALLGTVDDRLGLLGANLAAGLGGGTTYDPLTGGLATQLQVGATLHTTVQDALNQVNATANAGLNVSVEGALLSNVAPGQAVDFANADGNIVISKPADQNQLSFDLADDLNVANSLTVGGTTQLTAAGVTVGPNVQLGTTGLAINGGPSVTTAGINAGGQAIANVSAGVTATDAANMGQVAAVGAVANAGVSVSAQGLNGTTAALNSATGNAIDLRNTDGNLVVTKSAISNDVSFDLADDLSFDSMTVGGLTTINGTGVNVGGTVQLGTTGLTIAGGPAITTAGIDAGGQVVGNVAAGVATTDAVNVGQLNAVGAAAAAGVNVSAQGANATTAVLGSATGNTIDLNNTDGNLVITKGTTSNDVTFNLADDVAFDSLTIGGTTVLNGTGVAVGPNVQLGTTGLTIAGGPSVTTAGINAGGQVIGNVAAGVDLTDAVNVGQLNAVGNAANAGINVSVQGSNVTNVGAASATGNTMDLNNTDGNIVITKSPTSNDVTFNLADNLALDALTLGGTTTVDANGVTVGPNVQLGNAGLTIAGGPSVTSAGINAGGQVVSNVGPGLVDTDAVNLGQLNAVGAAANAGFNISAQGTNATNVSLASTTGNTIDFTNTDGNISITKAQDSNDLTFNLADSLAFDELTIAGTTTIGAAGVLVGPGVQLGTTGLVIAGGPSVTNGGIDAGGLPITNVGPGVAGTDAVNVNQLTSAIQSGGGARYYSINSTGGTNQVNDGATGTDAIAVGKSASAAGEAGVAMGLNSASVGARSVALGSGARAEQDDSLAFGNGALSAHANSIALGAGSLTTVGARLNYQAAFVGQVSSAGELNVGNRQITGIAAGSAPSDAATVGQVEAGVSQAVTTANAYTDTQVGALNASVDGLNTSVGQLNDRVGTIEGEVGTIRGDVDGLNGRVTGVEQALSDIGDVALFDDRVDDLENGASGVAQVSQDGPVIAAQATGANSMAIGNGAVSSGANGSALGNQSTASGVNSTAVGQGATASAANTTALGQGATASATNSTAVGQGATASHENSVALGSGSATTVGAQASYSAAYVGTASSVGEVNVGNRTISGVAPGVAGTDAVNVNQLNAGVEQAVTNANSYTDSRIDGLRQDNWNMRRDFRGATASAMAMAGIPQAYMPGKSFLGVGMGGYQGEYGVAVGVSTISESGRYIYKAQVSGNTAREWGFSVGAGIQW